MRARLPTLGAWTALLALTGCSQPDRPLPLSGPDVFFNGERLARIVSVELADRESVLREYVGLQVTARMQVTGATELAATAAVGKGGRYVVYGRADDLHDRIGVAYTVTFDDPSVLVHRVGEQIEVIAAVQEASWQTAGGDQTLLVAAAGKRLHRLSD